jgi:hypothetical protein
MRNNAVLIKIVVAAIVFALMVVAIPVCADSGLSNHKLVAYYPLDGDTQDHSGNGNHGTNHGGTFVSGVSGNALKFDGKDDYISTNYTQNSVIAYTIELWVKTTVDSCENTFVQNRGSGAGKSLTLGMGRSGGGRTIDGFGSSGQVFYILDSNSIDTGVHSVQTINDNNWHHVVGVWGASPETEIDPSQFKIYIDGVQVSTTSEIYDSSSHPKSPLTGLGGTKIAGHDAWNTNFNGIIDEISIYNYALTASDIKAKFDKILLPVDADSDGDGVPDDEDECTDTSLGTNVDEYGCPVDVSTSMVSVCASAKPSYTEGHKFEDGYFTIGGTAPQKVTITSQADNFVLRRGDGVIVYERIDGKSSGSLTLAPGTYTLSCYGGGAMGTMSATVCIEYPVVEVTPTEPEVEFGDLESVWDREGRYPTIEELFK